MSDPQISAWLRELKFQQKPIVLVKRIIFLLLFPRAEFQISAHKSDIETGILVFSSDRFRGRVSK
jgi:hypothetical protein